jgi:hypothetical protein
VSLPESQLSLMTRSHADSLSGPPPEVLSEVAAAWERAQEPLFEDLLLGFMSEPALGRAWGELRMADGTLVERISASEALALACGDAEILAAPAIAV